MAANDSKASIPSSERLRSASGRRLSMFQAISHVITAFGKARTSFSSEPIGKGGHQIDSIPTYQLVANLFLSS